MDLYYVRYDTALSCLSSQLNSLKCSLFRGTKTNMREAQLSKQKPEIITETIIFGCSNCQPFEGCFSYGNISFGVSYSFGKCKRRNIKHLTRLITPNRG